MNLRPAVVLFTILSSLLLTSAVDAQVTSSSLAGRILDSGGGVLPGVTVTARQTETRLLRSTTSDPQGRYTIPALPPGTYELRAELPGFRPLLRSGVTL